MEKKLNESQDSKGGFAEGCAEKRRRFDKIQVVEVSTDEAKRIPRGRGFKDNVLNWLKPKGVLGTHKNLDKGWDIIVSKSSVLEVLGHGAYEGKVALLEHVPELIKNGVYLETSHKKAGLNSHIFAAKANIDGDDYTVGFVVRDGGAGKRYYEHEIWIDSDGKIWAATDLRRQGSTEAKPQAESLPPLDDNTVYGIVRKHLGDNTNITNPDLKSKGKDKKSCDPTSDGPPDTPADVGR